MLKMVSTRFTVYAIREQHEIALVSRKAASLALRIVCTTTCHATEAQTSERHVNEIMLGTVGSAKLLLNLPLGSVLPRRPSSWQRFSRLTRARF